MSASQSSSDPETDLTMRASDSYARLRDMFATAAELDAAARTAWIEAHVADPEDRAALERLLRIDGESGYFDVDPGEHVTRMAGEPLHAQGLIGQRIGAFRLVRLIGQGGMAAVFLGEREAGDFAQRVAVKLLRRGLYSEVEQRLFRRERQLLAALEHPDIARLIDGGVTDAGVPYLVVEYVDGVPITRHAAQQRLDVRARLRLFLRVCRAVEAAHRALIVHRDIKPSNILVAGDSVVKLLDFGIAKLLDDEDNEHATVGAFTPEYAAPEQVANAPVTTATDVYALGLLLHELLLGERFHGQPTRKPSARIDATSVAQAGLADAVSLRRALRGDLDTILGKCLAAEPARRYASAGTLAADVERYLAGRPVEAHAPSRWYHVWKFVRRHRGSVALTAALTFAVLAAAVLALWQARMATREAARANRVREFVEDMFAPIDNSVIEAKQTSVHDLLAKATDKLERNGALAADERIDLELLFSRLHEKMGESQQALVLAAAAAQRAETQLAPDDPVALAAQIAYAYALLEHDDVKRAQPMFDLLEVRAAGRVHGMPLVQLFDGLADIADHRGDHENALAYERRALQERIVQSGADSARAGTGYNNLAISLDLSGHHDAAIDAFRRSYAIHLAHEGADSFETANARYNLGIAEMQAGRLQAARADFLAVESLFEAAPNNKRSRNARYWQDRCQLATAIGGADVQAACARALSVTREIVASSNVGLIVRALRFDAQMQLERGELDAAEADVQQANALLGASGDAVALGSNDLLLAQLDVARGNDAAAAVSYARGIARIGHAFPERLRLDALAERARLCASQAEPAACPPDATDVARAELDSGANARNPWLLPAQVAIARVDLERGQADAASARLRVAITQTQDEVDPAQIHLLSAHLWLAVAEARAKHCDAARAAWRETGATIGALSSAHIAALEPALAQLRKNDACGAIAD